MHVVPPGDDLIFHLIRQLIDQIMIVVGFEILAAGCVFGRAVPWIEVYTGHRDISFLSFYGFISAALVGLLGIDVPLDPHEVVDQVAELTALGVLVEHVDRADTLILAEVDLALPWVKKSVRAVSPFSFKPSMGNRLLAYMQTLPYLLVQRTTLSSLLPTRSMPRGVITMVGSTGVR
jgi:hypothetical protein